MLRTVLGATAAVAVLTVAKEAARADAAARTTVLGAATADNHGITVVPGADDPNTWLPALPNAHGVIGGLRSAGLPTAPSPSGVLGLATTTVGVQGLATSGIGAFGQSTDSVGVQGVSTNNAGVFGQGPIGVFGVGGGVASFFGSSGNGYAMWGSSTNNAGVRGESANSAGVQAFSTNNWGLHAKSPTWAGVFEGNIFVTGQVIALGGVGASATTTTRATVEDVGEAELRNGQATVTLAADAADAAHGDYRVFLTELADLGGLYVARKGPRDFEVRCRGGGPAGPRQAPLAPPDLTTVKPAPKPPEPPRTPKPSGGSDERRER